MAIELNDNELRVLGVLIEKSLTHPGSYPLTLNSIVLGANQKQNREPVFDLSEGEVGSAIYSLQRKELADNAATGPGSRSNRFLHKVVDVFGWDRREQAVMAELMLRSRQTAGELRTRASRMTPIPDLEAVGAILGGLMDRDPPFAEELPREPGRSACRVRHLLGGSDASSGAPSMPPAPPVGSIPHASPADDDTGPPPSAGRDDLAQRVTQLEEHVAKLTKEVDELKKIAAMPVDRDGESPL